MVPQTNLKDGDKPVWNETYTLPVHVKEHQCLTAIMYDSVRGCSPAPVDRASGLFTSVAWNYASAVPNA